MAGGLLNSTTLKKIGLDLDSTLVDLPVVAHISKELGLDLRDEDFHDWQFSQFPPVYASRSKELFKSVEFMCNLLPYPGAYSKLKEWKSFGNDLILITARDRSIQGMTVKMVNDLFPNIFTYIDFVNPGQSKKDLMSKYHLDIWIDDNPRDVQTSMDLGIRSFLISNAVTSYNHEFAFHNEKNNYLLTVVDSVSKIQLER